MSAYYNEIDKNAAQWLRNLITAGHIAAGDVDERDIRDVRPDDIRGYTQCHFFAGIGVWSYALRRAGWHDDRPVWTGSCPCQPFSSAGKGTGFDDERHLWPAWYHLVGQCKPAIVFGEQVASKDADAWIDLVHDDMEALGYAFGAVPFPSASVGAPHIRDRNYWVANAANKRQLRGRSSKACNGADEARVKSERFRQTGSLDNPICNGRSARRDDDVGNVGVILDTIGDPVGLADIHKNGCSQNAVAEFYNNEHHSEPCGSICRLADTNSGQRDGVASSKECQCDRAASRWEQGDSQFEFSCETRRPGPTNGYWRIVDWLGCTDGKWRPVEPGTFPLAHGATARVGRLRAYGNAINAEAAKAFIEAVEGYL